MPENTTSVKILFQQLRERLQGFLPPEEVDSYATWLLEAVFDKSRMDLVLNNPVQLSEAGQEKLEQVLVRLEKQEPIQYVLEQAPFYGRMFHVNSSVLIPRSETEELVQLIVQEQKGKSQLQVLDVGTGSGCIAISLALELSSANVFAVDVSKKALQVARGNAAHLGASVNFIKADILEDKLFSGHQDPPLFDVIVSNPPYVRKNEALQMKKNVLSYEPHLALFVEDEEPLLFYRRIAIIAKKILKNGGKLYFEINEAFGAETAEMLRQHGFQSLRIHQDMQGKDRMLGAEWPSKY